MREYAFKSTRTYGDHIFDITISTDNVVSGKRTRGRFVLSPDGSPRGRVSTSGQSGAERGPQSPKPGPSRQSAKRKLMPGGPSSSRSGSPVPKKGRGIAGKGLKSRGDSVNLSF